MPIQNPYEPLPPNFSMKLGMENHQQNMADFSRLMSAKESLSAPGDENMPVINNNIRKGWNDYIAWLQSKGLKGHPSLDKNNLGLAMIDLYRKENPDTPITKDLVIPIQKDFANYRKWSIDSIKAGKGAFAEGTNEQNYLSALSIVDGIPGQRTTSYTYPSEFLKVFENGELKKVENKGFATAKK